MSSRINGDRLNRYYHHKTLRGGIVDIRNEPAVMGLQDTLDRLNEQDARVAELEAENAKLREALEAHRLLLQKEADERAELESALKACKSYAYEDNIVWAIVKIAEVTKHALEKGGTE